MKKTVIKCTSRADWGRIIQWAEEIKPNCTRYCYGDIGSYYGFDWVGDFSCWKTPLSGYTVLELSDFIAYPVKKEMLVGDDKINWSKKIVVGEWIFENEHIVDLPYLDDNGSCWYYAKPINPNQEKIEEIDRQIAELTKQKEELCK